MSNAYPSDYASLSFWAEAEGATAEEARVRLAQVAVLCCIGTSSTLRDCLVFKGGNALDLVWLPNRSTRDLDFSINRRTESLADDATLLRAEMDAALRRPPPEHQIVMRLQSLRQEPSRPDASFATFRLSVGYAFADERRLRLRLDQGRPSPRAVPLDISTNEEVCGFVSVMFNNRHNLLVSTREDVLAEKLRALLQQQSRNRYRAQDMLDIAVMVDGVNDIDLDLVGEYLVRKARARGIDARKAAFSDLELARRAAEGYEDLRELTRVKFIEFNEALEILQRLVSSLPIPD